MRLKITNDDGSVEEHDGKDVMILHLNYRPPDVAALEEVLKILKNVTKREARSILVYASDVTERRSV